MTPHSGVLLPEKQKGGSDLSCLEDWWQVAGTNYFVKVLVKWEDGNDEYLALRIYKSLPHMGGGSELAGYTIIDEEDEIHYFEPKAKEPAPDEPPAPA
eukprot:CAMPEP_0180404968 /NCGR_PEP_ID=MMETSP0989-20121125/40334_1 /TAXON_ID=697907 /ORGANISM="non described non described, Strain CCMP2293" /LENGTH=97 /DNA_ID=CAMNT_0022408491 /DNA_START=558 /DNA_END=852 /DNA_ORIENTATION=-